MKHLGDFFDSAKMFTFLRGYAMGKNWHETIKALNFVRQMHKGQSRKSGEPYIIHPEIMACQAVSLGVDDDEIVASCLYHDVVEDCNVSLNDLPCSKEIKDIVKLLTYVKPDKYMERDGEGPSIEDVKQLYYRCISEHPKASIVKILDRCNNVSSMSGVFSKEKLVSYIDETNKYVMPLIKSTKEQFPEYGNILFVLKYHIVSVLTSIQGVLV